MRHLFAAILAVWPSFAAACDLALVLAVDVSGSVDNDEYRTQMDGLATALRDGIVTDALIAQATKVTLVQWSGASRQVQTLPWIAIANEADVAALAKDIAHNPRAWRNFSTAVGEAVALSIDLLAQQPDCRRKVIDVSGDGRSNEGIEPAELRARLAAQEITVNALAIETDNDDLTAYFFENLIAGEGAFVITANGFADYPAQIRRKLQRETTEQLSNLAVQR